MEEQNQLDSARLLLGEHFDFALQLRMVEERHQGETRRLLLALLEVMDSFDRYLRGRGGDEVRTVRLMAQQLEKALQLAGVEGVASLGQLADPQLHEIAGTRCSDAADEFVIEELRRGYRWEGEVLRKACVIVAGKPEREE